MTSKCGVPVKLAVVGAGVIGLSSAYHLVEKFGDEVSVTVIAEKFSPNTTSDKAGGIIHPISFTSVDPDEQVRLQQWTADTFKHFNSLYQSESAGEIGLCVLAGYMLKNEKHPTLPWWKDIIFDFRSFSSSSSEVKMLKIPQNYQTVWAFSTYLVDCRQYLPWLMGEFIRRGGAVEQRRLSTLDELSHYDVIVNCSGLSAAELVGDRELRPVRAQAVVVRAPWIKHFITTDNAGEDMTYIFPRPNDVLLGGTAQDGNWDETVDPSTSEAILSRCAAVLPGLRGAEVVGAWAGGRPMRNVVRLEEERGTPQLVIHCYGHGGQGVSLHWGCALDMGRMVESYIISAHGSAGVPPARF